MRRPLSVVLLAARGATVERLALVARPALRPGWSVCDMGQDRLLIICPETSRPGAVAVRDELSIRLSRLPAEIAISTANSATTAQKLLDRLDRNRRRTALDRSARATVTRSERETAGAREG